MKESFKIIFTILGWIGKIITGIRNTFVNILLLFLFIIFVVSLSMEKAPPLPENAALILTIAGNVVEEKEQSGVFAEYLSENWEMDQPPSETKLQDILDAIDNAKNDSRITCILLDLKYLGAVSLSQLQTIGHTLDDFKQSGKEVIAAEDFYSQRAYYLAAHSSKVFLNPMGGVDIHGFGLYRLYFKEALDKLKITYNTFKVGTYKSALEPIMRNSMSKAAKEQNTMLLSDLWDTYLADIMAKRSLSKEVLKTYTDNISAKLAETGGDTARLALQTGLVDELRTRPEFRRYMVNLTGKSKKRNQNFAQIRLKDYLKDTGRSYTGNSFASSSSDQVGIIIAQGIILSGKQPPGTIGDESLSEVIFKAAKDEKIKAMVLRIDSGGGSVFASETIRQELLAFKKTGKPLVISMGSMAASGGYWIAADADEIWAEPTTITGSIGIFGAIPTFENAIQDLGIRSDGIGTTPLAAGMNLTRAMPPMLKETVQQSVNHGYNTFLSIVAKGRGLTTQDVDKIAQGRVWSGTKAQSLGLVDNLGSLEDAIDAAGKLAALQDYTSVYIQKPLTFGQEIMKMLQGNIANVFLSSVISPELAATVDDFFMPIKETLNLNDPKGIYARCLIRVQ